MTQTAKKLNPRQFFKHVALIHSRLHESQLVLLVIFPSNKKQYDNLNKSESQKLTDLMTNIYDIYQPEIATINCGHKTCNNNPKIHWLFDFNKDKFISNLTYITSNSPNNKAKKLTKHIQHFNKKCDEFSNYSKLKNYTYIQKDILLYTKMTSHIIPSKIASNKINFNQIKYELNTNYNHRSTSLFIIIDLNQNEPCFSAYSYRKQIDDALQTLKQFTHYSRDLVIDFIKHKNGSLSNVEYQALEWFELSVTHSKQQILIRSTVTIFHFMFILFHNSKISNAQIQNWFQKYSQYVEQKCRMLEPYKEISCSYNNHNILHLNYNAMQLNKLEFIGKGTKNRTLNVNKAVIHGINQISVKRQSKKQYEQKITDKCINNTKTEDVRYRRRKNEQINRKVDCISNTIYECKQCNVVCNSKQVLDTHFYGKKHQKKIKQKETNYKTNDKTNDNNKLQLKQAINNILNHIGNDVKWNTLVSELKKYDNTLK